VAEARLLPLVVANLDDELRRHRAPFPRDLRPPAARLPARLPFGVGPQERLHALEDLLAPLARSRRGPHRPEFLALVEAEHDARDAGALLAPGHAEDDTVGGLLALHLDDPLPRAGEVGEALALRDHPVEAGHLEPVEPALGDLAVARRRRDGERQLLDPLSTLLERKLVDRLAVPQEEVEGDEVGRHLAGELLDAALGGMEAHLERVEIERTVALDDDFAVDGRMRRELLGERLELREIAEEGPAVTAPEMQLPGHVLEDPAETVPLRLVLPAVRLGQLVDQLGLHGGKRKLGRNRCSHCAV